MSVIDIGIQPPLVDADEVPDKPARGRGSRGGGRGSRGTRGVKAPAKVPVKATSMKDWFTTENSQSSQRSSNRTTQKPSKGAMFISDSDSEDDFPQKKRKR